MISCQNRGRGCQEAVSPYCLRSGSHQDWRKSRSLPKGSSLQNTLKVRASSENFLRLPTSLFGDVYLRSSVLAGRCLPAVLWCIPPVVSPTLSGSIFVYTSGGSCGCACHTRPRIETFTSGGQRCLPAVLSPTLGGSKFAYTSGGSCGRAYNLPPIDWDIYLRCKKFSYRARYRPLAMSERKAQRSNQDRRGTRSKD